MTLKINTSPSNFGFLFNNSVVQQTANLVKLNKHNLLKTMLNAENGERALSNYFQIAEIIQSINSKVIGSNAQLLWFKDLVLNGNSDLSDDVTKKHLESEQSLVKIYTIHKSKGLQYPIVFSPFLFGTTNYDKDGIYYDPHDRHVSLSLKTIGLCAKLSSIIFTWSIT